MSTWNMPPGCSTNDIPSNRSDGQDVAEDDSGYDGYEDEDAIAEEAYANWKSEREDQD